MTAYRLLQALGCHCRRSARSVIIFALSIKT